MRMSMNYFKDLLWKCSDLAAIVLAVVLLWATLWGVLGAVALPGGHLFALVVLVSACAAAGKVVENFRLPALLGMLIMGFMLRNVPYVDVAKDLNPEVSAVLRSAALVVILLRAGIGLDPSVLRRLSLVCLRLSFTPCLVEAVTVGIVSHFVLGFPWIWGFMLGFVLAAVSPAVVVPCMLTLQQKQLGVNKGIPTLVIAAASVDDVLAITGFGICLGISFSQGNLAWTIAKGPLEAFMGVAFGCLLGACLWYLPDIEKKSAGSMRFILLLLGGFLAMFCSQRAELAGAGPLGALSIAFMASLGWRKQGWSEDNNPSSLALKGIWTVLQPVLFGLIGSEVHLSILEAKTIGLGMACLAIGLCLRILVTFCVVFGAEFSLKEKFFIAIAWLPKATVQAAIGTIALDHARSTKAGKDVEYMAIQILTIAVLSIIVTAPIGAAFISISAPKLLDKSSEPDVETRQQFL